MNKRSEAAIKAWLKLPKEWRSIGSDPYSGIIVLYEICKNVAGFQTIARFTLESIIAKRLPAKKKKKGKK